MRYGTMCRIASVLVLAALVLAPAAAQVPDDLPLEPMEQAFRRGDVRALMEHTADRIEMAVHGAGMLYSRGQAAYVVDQFFRRYPPLAFTLEDVARADESWFAAGRYRARGEDHTHRVFLRLRHNGRAWELIEVRISTDGGS